MQTEKRSFLYAENFSIGMNIFFQLNKYLAQFVVSKLGKSDNEIDKYIQEIIKADMEESGTEDVFRKIKRDF